MKNQITALLLAGALSLSVCGCGTKNQQETPPLTTAETGSYVSAESKQEEVLPPEDTSLFSDFRLLQFTFSSGAGGWGTLMHINPDGSFSGEYSDSEMGLTDKDYPNGTRYQCLFSGKFTEPVQVNDYTYSLQIQEISYEKEPGTEKIIDGILYCYGKPYGLDGAEEILIYAPGAPLNELPEDYRNWVGCSDPMLEITKETMLPFWGFYNVSQECGFASHNLIEQAKEIVELQKEAAADIKDSMETDASLNQAELNEKSQQLYESWDLTLNRVWDILKQILDKDAMNQLITEEREWIKTKEQAASEAGTEAGGGSLTALLTYLKAAQLTEIRVYELLEMLK